MATAPPKREIELIPQEDWEKTSLGKLLKWTLTVGRYIVISTELIVILAFLSRFKLDQDLNNLYEEIEEKQTRIEAMSTFEENFRFLQKRLAKVDEMENIKAATDKVIDDLVALVPLDVSLDSLSVTGKQIDLSATAFSEEGLASFLNNLKNSPRFDQLNITALASGTEKEIGIQFKLTFGIKSTENQEQI